MSAIVINLTRARIIDAIEANLSAYYLPYGTLLAWIIHGPAPGG